MENQCFYDYQSQPRIYKIYLPQEKQWIEVTQEQYQAYNRDIWATRKRAQKHRQCMCPKSKLWLCDGDCLVCKFHAPGDSLSLDLAYENEDGGALSLLDKLADHSASIDDVVTDQIMLRKALGIEAEDPTKSLTWFNEEMDDCATGYVAYVLEQIEAAKQVCSDPVVLIEQRVDFSRWVEGGFGTADALIIADGTLKICDYKHGLWKNCGYHNQHEVHRPSSDA